MTESKHELEYEEKNLSSMQPTSAIRASSSEENRIAFGFKEHQDVTHSKMISNSIDPEMKKFIGPKDVILGRGTGPNQNPGNTFYRNFLKSYLSDYRMASETSHGTHTFTKSLLSCRKAIVAKVIDDFHKLGGRFLQKKSSIPPMKVNFSQHQDQHCRHYTYRINEGSSESFDFEVVSHREIVMKTRQALRYLMKSNSSDGKSAGDQGKTHTSSKNEKATSSFKDIQKSSPMTRPPATASSFLPIVNDLSQENLWAPVRHNHFQLSSIIPSHSSFLPLVPSPLALSRALLPSAIHREIQLCTILLEEQQRAQAQSQIQEEVFKLYQRHQWQQQIQEQKLQDAQRILSAAHLMNQKY